MTRRWDIHHRLEPRRGERPLEQSIAAEVADPAWFLGRQWQLGEHQGANAASPVRLDVERTDTPIEATGRDRRLRPQDTPQTTPPEALVEGEADEWWTPGRRVAFGLMAAAALPDVGDVRAALAKGAADRSAEQTTLARSYGPLLLHALPVPYQDLEGTGWDGRALFAAKSRKPLAGRLPAGLFDAVPSRAQHWDPATLEYAGEFKCGNARLRIDRHDGGAVEWWSARSPVELRARHASTHTTVWPTRIRYPGSPHPRWWQIEDGAVDIGGYPPDRAHLATMLLIDLLSTHADDWFTWTMRSSQGHVTTLHRLEVRDAFGENHTRKLAPHGGTAPSAPAPTADWSLFAVTGLGEWSLPLWLTASAPLAGDLLEQVVLAVDEDANLLWGVEERVDGRAVVDEAADRPVVEPGGSTEYHYAPSTDVPAHWHPYMLEDDARARTFAQARLADLTAGSSGAALRLLPRGRVLTAGAGGGAIHRISAAAIPPAGLRVERRYLLARRTDGSPVLWMERRRRPLLAPPSNVLRFDVAEHQRGS